MAIDPNTLNLAALEQQHGLPRGLLQSVMSAESSGNPNAVSPKGAQGLFQFMPQTAKAYGINPLDPQQAAVGAARMYGDLSKQFGGNLPSMLAAYNWGSGNLARKGMESAPLETRNYIDRVQKGMTTPNKQYAQADTGTMTDAIPDLPEGFVLHSDFPSLPDGFVVNGDASTPQNQDGYLSRTTKSITDSALKGADILASGKHNPTVAAIQAGGEAAKMVAAPVVEAVVSGFRSLPQDVQNKIGSTAKNVSNKAEGGFHKLVDYLDTTEVGRAFGDLGVGNPTLQEGMEEVSDTAKAVGNIATVLSPTAKVNGVTVGNNAGKSIEKAGKAIYKSGEKIEDAAKNKLAADLYTPKLTPTVLKERAANTVTQGINQKPVYVPPAHEAAAIKTLEALPLKKSNTLQKNLNIVSNEVGNEAKSLSTMLQRTPVKYKPDFFKNILDNSLAKLKTDPLIIGDGEKVAERIFNKMKEISAKNPATPDGLLKSRIEFDRWARSKRGNVFDANDTAFSTAVRNAREVTNDFISQTAPHAAVRASLLKQSHLLRAMDNIVTKIPTAPRTRLGMVAEKAKKFVPDSGPAKLVGATALGGIGWAAPVATVAMATTGAGAYGAYKLAASPMIRKGIGKAIEKSGTVLKSAPAPTLFGDEPPDSPLARFGAKFDRKVTNKGAP